MLASVYHCWGYRSKNHQTQRVYAICTIILLYITVYMTSFSYCGLIILKACTCTVAHLHSKCLKEYRPQELKDVPMVSLTIKHLNHLLLTRCRSRIEYLL